MSKVGKMIITIPAEVTIEVVESVVKVTGKGGVLTHTLPHGIKVVQAENTLTVTRSNDEKIQKALHGTTRALLANMVTGVSTGFTKILELVGTGYRAKLAGNKLILALGFSHEIEYVCPAGTNIQVEGTNLITITGLDKQAVGQVAAEIREYRKPEPYKGKGIRYQGEVVRRKAGKAAKGATA